MKAHLKAWSAKFDALQQREKVLVAVATVFVIGMGGYSLGVEPVLLRSAALKKQIAQQRTEMLTLRAQIDGLRAQLKDPDAANKVALVELRERIAASDRALHEYDNKLVPPDRVPQLLQSLFVRHHGLQLVSLQTLAPLPLLAPRPAEGKPTDGKPVDGKAPQAAAPVKGGNIHKHGIEIRMAGNYLDLLAYVTELEQLPQKLLWGRMSLATDAWPRSELTLTVYTLSLDPTWMIV